jgi:hypothetical protein
MIQLNPNKRITATEALKHRYISYMLVNELDLPVRYLDETKVVASLDDNLLFKIKDYQDKIQDFIDQKELKSRRFIQKTRMINKEIDREHRKRALDKRSQNRRRVADNMMSQSVDEYQDDDIAENDVIGREVELKAILEKNKEYSEDMDEFNYNQK